MDSARWTQEFVAAKSMSDQIISPPSPCTRPTTTMEKKARPPPQKDQNANCPRCHSTNTKFCYYNNYSLTQPRYFCKTCRRYWTHGGTLRNVPVGGGSRKHKKITTPNNSTSTSSLVSSQNPNKIHHEDQRQDLNLGFRGPQDYQHMNIPQFLEFPKIENRDILNSSNNNSSNSSAPISALNFLRNGIGLNSFMPMGSNSNGMESNNAIFASSGFHQFQETKPVFSFLIDGTTNNGSRFDNNSNVSSSQENGTLVFPFGSAKQQGDDDQVVKGQENNSSNGYWSGMLGGGGSW